MSADASTSAEFVGRYLARSPRRLTAVLLGRIDSFNRIGTTFGEERSKVFCAECIDHLLASLPADAPLLRLSDRRFIVLLPLQSMSGVMDYALHLTESEHALRVGEDSLFVDVTLGIAVHPTHADEAATLLRRAELALNEARERETAFALYSPDSTRRQVALWKLESDFEHAVQRRELDVHFQPKADLERRQVCGVEALARWRTSSGEFVPPRHFIPLAERSGAIVPMTWLVFERIVESLEGWSWPGRAFSVAVNVAPQVLGHDEFFPRLERLREALERVGTGLTLELTEDSLVPGDALSIGVLERIRETGVGLAIDDFGKGYSSLSYLKELPATEIKIDKRFVSSLATDEKDRHIVGAVIELARAFGMTVVAEGVNDPGSLRAVADLGCDVAQGFFIARPVRAQTMYRRIQRVEREAAHWPIAVRTPRPATATA